MRRFKAVLLLLIFSGVVSCNDKTEKAFSEEEIEDHSVNFNNYLAEQFQEDVADSPMLQTQIGLKTDYDKLDDFSNVKLAEDLERSKRRLDYIKEEVDEEALNEETHLSYKLYLQLQKDKVEDYEYRFYDYPINQMGGYHTGLPAFMINMHRIDSIDDARDYIARLNEFPRVFNEIIEGMVLREQNGIVPPLFVFERVLDASRNVLKGRPFVNSKEASTLLEDFEQKVAALELEEESERELLSDAEQALLKSVKPAYEKLIAKLQDQQQRATVDHGVWKFPKGETFYSHALKRVTTTDYTSDEIHEIGLKEVSRIHGEMEKIMEEVGFEGTLQDFFEFLRSDPQFYYEDTPEGRQAYLTEATEVINTMKGQLNDVFLTLPEADIVVKAVEPFRERSAGKAFYQRPALDGSRPGIYYANLYDMAAMPKYQLEALAYHEGIPGHHMQLAIAQELDGIPDFRKFSSYTAYIEGWGLYSELLPKEMGFYEDPYSDFGRLAMELWRAVRLVVDTGIHSKKWTREQGIEYYKQNTPNAESDAIKMVERHIVLPGQATAYKIGMIKILELREYAKSQLGDKFDLREFHDVILLNGAVPLNILEENVRDWVKSVQE